MKPVPTIVEGVQFDKLHPLAWDEMLERNERSKWIQFMNCNRVDLFLIRLLIKVGKNCHLQRAELSRCTIDMSTFPSFDQVPILFHNTCTSPQMNFQMSLYYFPGSRQFQQNTFDVVRKLEKNHPGYEYEDQSDGAMLVCTKDPQYDQIPIKWKKYEYHIELDNHPYSLIEYVVELDEVIYF